MSTREHILASEEDVTEAAERGQSMGDLAKSARVRAERAHYVAEERRAMAVALAWEAGDDDAFNAPTPDC